MNTITTTREDPEVARLRAEIAKAQAAARAAVDALDPTGGIAHLRAMKSALWRLERLGIRPERLLPDADERTEEKA